MEKEEEIKRVEAVKKIALEGASWTERDKAIEILGNLGEVAFGALAEIGLKGQTWSERNKALEMLSNLAKKG